MSWRASQWAMAQTAGSPIAKAVLLVIAEAAGVDNGRTFVGTATISKRAELSERSVRTGLGALVSAGLITRTRRFNPVTGQRTTDDIALQIPAGYEPPDESANRQDVPLATTLEAGDAGGPSGTSGMAYRQITYGQPATGVGPSGTSCTPLTGTYPVSNRIEPEREASTPSKKPAKAVRLATGWRPPNDGYEFGAELGLTSSEVEAETSKFRDHAKANARSQVDWDATWRNWLRKAVEWKRDRRPAQQERQSAIDLAEAAIHDNGWGLAQ